MFLRKYFNNRADIWDENIAEQDAGKLAAMADRLRLEPGDVLLDVGTGTGVFLPFLVERIGTAGQVVAMDLAEEMLARARCKSCNGRVDYIQADIMDIPLGDGLFDGVVCYSSFPHFQDKLKALIEIKRVLKSGGKVVVCHTSGRAHINEIHSSMEDVKNDLLPDPGEMASLLSEAGFGEIQVEEDGESYFACGVKSS